MTQLNKTIAKQLATLLAAYDATLDTQESQLTELLAYTKQHHVDREHVHYAITCYVAKKYDVEMNDKHQLVKACDNHKTASKRRERLMHSIYGEPKPKTTSNKVDPMEREAARLRKAYTPAQLRRLFASLGVK